MDRVKRICFSVTKAERREIETFCRKKKRWKNPPDLARDAVYQLMARYPIYQKKGETDDGQESIRE